MSLAKSWLCCGLSRNLYLRNRVCGLWLCEGLACRPAVLPLAAVPLPLLSLGSRAPRPGSCHGGASAPTTVSGAGGAPGASSSHVTQGAGGALYSAEGSALGCGELRHRAVSHLAGCLVRVALARATLPFAAALWSPPGPVGASCVGTAGPGRRGPPVFVQLGELRGTAFGVCDKPGKSRVPGVVTGTPLGQAPRPQHCCGRRGARPLSPCSGPSSS